jgi:cell division protein FtsZ
MYMTFDLVEPVLIIGLGGVGSKLATNVKETIGADCIQISNDRKDLGENDSIEISTKSIINPSVQLIRGCTMESINDISESISNYKTIIIMANLAGKAGAAISPVVSSICKEQNKNVLSFAIMPFKFEKDRIFQSGISLKRLRANSDCTIIIDNDALLDSNPDLTPQECYDITNKAIQCLTSSIKSSSLSEETNILSTSRDDEDLETSLKDSMRMLYEDTAPHSIKRSMLYVYGGSNVPIGIINSMSNIVGGIFEDDSTQIDMSSSESTNVVMLSSIRGETRFDKYDPLGIISQEKTIDWDDAECSIDCQLDIPQLE